MEIKELNKLVDELAGMRRTKTALKDKLDAKRAKLEEKLAPVATLVRGMETDIALKQQEILEALQETGTKSWKTEEATISRKSSVTYTIKDEAKVIAQLKDMKLAHEYVRETIIPETKQLFDKQDFAGVEKVEKEFISVIVKEK